MAYRTVNDHIAGVDLVYRLFPPRQCQIIRDSVARDIDCLPGWAKTLVIVKRRSGDMAVECWPENHMAKLHVSPTWFGYSTRLRRVYILHEFQHIAHNAIDLFAWKHISRGLQDEYTRLNEQYIDDLAYTMLKLRGGK